MVKTFIEAIRRRRSAGPLLLLLSAALFLLGAVSFNGAGQAELSKLGVGCAVAAVAVIIAFFQLSGHFRDNIASIRCDQCQPVASRQEERMERLRLGWSRGRLAVFSGGFAAFAMAGIPAIAQQAQTLSGAPIQMQPFVVEPGAPTVTVDPGTPNPFGGLDGGDGSGGTGGSSGSGDTGSSDALTTMLGTSWGATAAANAQALGVNASALAATCVVESGLSKRCRFWHGRGRFPDDGIDL